MQHDILLENFLCGVDKQIIVSQLFHQPEELELGVGHLGREGFILHAVKQNWSGWAVFHYRWQYFRNALLKQGQSEWVFFLDSS